MPLATALLEAVCKNWQALKEWGGISEQACLAVLMLALTLSPLISNAVDLKWLSFLKEWNPSVHVLPFKLMWPEEVFF